MPLGHITELYPFAVISDIHSNLQALDAVLEDIEKRNVKTIICLGDVVGYGANPCEAIDLVNYYANIILSGNHDHSLTHQFNMQRWNSIAQRTLLQNLAQMFPDRAQKNCSQNKQQNTCIKAVKDFLLSAKNALGSGSNKTAPTVKSAPTPHNKYLPLNHPIDAQGADKVLGDQLMKESTHYEWLCHLNRKLIGVDGVAFCHACPEDPMGIKNGEDSYINQYGKLEMKMYDFQKYCNANILFYGHTHLLAAHIGHKASVGVYGEKQRPISRAHETNYFVQESGDASSLSNNIIVIDDKLLKDNMLWVNPGSVGQPRDGDNRASYVIHHGDRIQSCRVPYDIEAAQNAIKKLYKPYEGTDDMVNTLCHRLEVGR